MFDEGSLICVSDEDRACDGSCDECLMCYRAPDGDHFSSRCGHPPTMKTSHWSLLDAYNERLFRCEGCRKLVFYDIYRKADDVTTDDHEAR